MSTIFDFSPVLLTFVVFVTVKVNVRLHSHHLTTILRMW